MGILEICFVEIIYFIKKKKKWSLNNPGDFKGVKSPEPIKGVSFSVELVTDTL